MATQPAQVADAEAFDQFEIDGWRGLSESYHRRLGPMTSRAAPTLLAAAAPQKGERLLDVGTGPGYIAGSAVALGLAVTGCDVSEDMVALARTLHPDVPIDVADGRDLPYPDEYFDIVTSGFVLLHTALPQVMVDSAVRVLRPGGRFVASVYDEPSKARFAGVFGQALGSVEFAAPPMPPGPGLFELSSTGALHALLAHAGLERTRVEPLEFVQHVESAQTLFDDFALSTVRAGAILKAQDEHTKKSILGALADALEPYRTDDDYEVPVSFLVASGVKPKTEQT